MDNADIFYTDIIHGQDGSDGGNGTCLINDIAVEGILFLDRAAGGVAYGIPVLPGILKHLIQAFPVPLVHQIFCLDVYKRQEEKGI